MKLAITSTPSCYFFNHDARNLNHPNMQQLKQFQPNYFQFSAQETVSNQSKISSFNLKIPTTPSRSKSLSPSLRQVVQPPRMRHKQLKQQPYPQPKLKFLSQNSAFKGCVSASCQSSKSDLISNSHHSDDVSSLSEFSSIYSVNSDESRLCNTSKDCLENSRSSPLVPYQNETKRREITIRLPSNVRALNLNNFPSDQPRSIPYKRMRRVHASRGLEANVAVLEQNIQFIFDRRLKSLTDTLRREFIEPGLRMLGSQQSDVVESLVFNLIEKSQCKSQVKKMNDEKAADDCEVNKKRKFVDEDLV